MTLRKTLLAAAAMALPLAAQAQPVDGFYVGAGAGVNWLQDTRYENLNSTATYGIGWGAMISLGYGFGNGIRAEIEGSYRDNPADQLRSGGSSPSARGSAQTYGVMGNAFFDFEPLFLGISPYIGVGAGYMWHNQSGIRETGTTRGPDGSDARFAYQAIVGAALPIAEVPGLSLTAEYRYMATLEQTIPVSNPAVGGPRNTTATPQNHSLFFGIRYAFGASPAMPVAVAPEPARTYLVFFDWNRDDLSDRARQIIADAAANSRRVQTTRIEVAGHADRTGTAQYNQRLSERRAENVAAELVRRGVPRNEIATVGFGFDRPLVPTADGVREPQNRRVEIVLR